MMHAQEWALFSGSAAVFGVVPVRFEQAVHFACALYAIANWEPSKNASGMLSCFWYC